MSRYAIKRGLTTVACSTCQKQTLYDCMECHVPLCPMCSFSMHAMCQSCRTAYVGPIHMLGKRSDAYIRAEFERLFE